MKKTLGRTLKSFINMEVWVKVHHRVANGTVLIVSYVKYYIIACHLKIQLFQLKNSVCLAKTYRFDKKIRLCFVFKTAGSTT